MFVFIFDLEIKIYVLRKFLSGNDKNNFGSFKLVIFQGILTVKIIVLFLSYWLKNNTCTIKTTVISVKSFCHILNYFPR